MKSKFYYIIVAITTNFKMSRSNTVNSAASDPQHHQQFQQIIQKWEKVKADPAHIDPTEVLCEMADILEKVRYIF